MSEIIVTTKEELQRLISESVRTEVTKLIPLSATSQVTPADGPESAKVYTRKEVAKTLKVSLSTLDSYVREGKITAFRIGNSVRFTHEAVEDALKQIQPAKKIA